MSKANNKELEEAIRRLDHIEKYYDCNNYYSKYDLDCIETVLKELKRLQEENKNLKQANTEKANKLIEIIDLYIKSVPKDQIREKIEEMQEEYELLLEHQNGQESNRTKYLRGKIHMGQELLERK